MEMGGESVIEDLSFDIREGEFLTILGPNGSGKTVLIKTLLGILPYEGEILWKKERRFGYLPQGLSPMKLRDLPLSVREFFAFRNLTMEKSLSFLKLVGLEEDILAKELGEISFGQLQRVLVSWVMVAEPNVLFLDEPTGIDIGAGETFYSLLKRFWQEKNLTILLSTHDLDIVYKYSTNVICLRKKSFRCFGPPREVLTPQSLEKIYGTEIKFYEHKGR